jgi:hypothetical protein
MSYKAVLCSQCHQPILLDTGRRITVGGGSTPCEDSSKECEILCPDCHTVTRSSDKDIVTAE